MKIFSLLSLAALVTVSLCIKCYVGPKKFESVYEVREIDCQRAIHCKTNSIRTASFTGAPYYECDEERLCDGAESGTAITQREGYQIESICCEADLCNANPHPEE